jgi:S-adenosylmethionine decarboxylase proenzyme
MTSISLGRHLLIEYFGCDRKVINNKEFLREALLEAARRANATIVTDVFHEFNPHGISGVVVIAESHLAIHTWPEHLCAAVDIFSCSKHMKPEVIKDFLQDVFKAGEVLCREIERGHHQSPITKNV